MKHKLKINPVIDPVITVWITENKSSRVRYEISTNVEGDERSKTARNLKEATTTALDLYLDVVGLSYTSRPLQANLSKGQLHDAEEVFRLQEGTNCRDLWKAMVMDHSTWCFPKLRVPLIEAFLQFEEHVEYHNIKHKDYKGHQTTLNRFLRANPDVDYVGEIRAKHVAAYFAWLNYDLRIKQQLPPAGDLVYSLASHYKHIGRLRVFFDFCENRYFDPYKPETVFLEDYPEFGIDDQAYKHIDGDLFGDPDYDECYDPFWQAQDDDSDWDQPPPEEPLAPELN